MSLLIQYKCKKLNSLKKVDMAYITQLKRQKSKRCHYFGSTLP